MCNKGFTLVEILIVVIILAILAAIVIPQFAGASAQASQSALVSDLQAIRSQVELYKIHHLDLLPGEIRSGATITPATADSFVAALINKTDIDGNVDDGSGGAQFKYGKYMESLPQNPFNRLNTVAVGAVKLTAVGDNSTGWYFVISGVDKGTFQANDSGTNPDDLDASGDPKPHTSY